MGPCTLRLRKPWPLGWEQQPPACSRLPLHGLCDAAIGPVESLCAVACRATMACLDLDHANSSPMSTIFPFGALCYLCNCEPPCRCHATLLLLYRLHLPGETPRRPCAPAGLKPEWEGPQPSARSPPNSWQGYCGSYSSLAFFSSKRENAKNGLETRTITASCCKTARSSIKALQLQNPSAQLHVESTFHRFEVDARCALIAA